MSKHKEKALELFESYYMYVDKPYETNAKQCALIAVNLHLDELSKMKLIFSDREIHYKHWEQVKKELESYE